MHKRSSTPTRDKLSESFKASSRDFNAKDYNIDRNNNNNTNDKIFITNEYKPTLLLDHKCNVPVRLLVHTKIKVLTEHHIRCNISPWLYRAFVEVSFRNKNQKRPSLKFFF